VPTPKATARHATSSSARLSPTLRIAAVLIVLAVVALACTTGGGSSARSQANDGDAETRGLRGAVLHLSPDRGPASRPTDPPPAASLPGDVPIDHVVFIVKENRTFDTIFGTYPGAVGATEGKTLDGRTVPLEPAPDVMTVPLTHGFWSGLFSIDGGRMDGFDTIIGGHNLDGYVQYDRTTVPHYFKYADRFVLSDRFFTSEYGPTYPEHLYTIAAQSAGIMDNKAQTTKSPGRYCDDPKGFSPHFPLEDLTAGDIATIIRAENEIIDDHPENLDKIEAYLEPIRDCLQIRNLPEELSAAGVSWRFYSDPVFPIGDVMRAIKKVRYTKLWNNVVPADDFISDIERGKLAQVSWVNPPAPYNEHPILPHRAQSMCAGENWTVAVMNALQRSPDWKSTAVVIIWDDFGGYYDHVVPPQYDIMGLGPRTPGLILSPWTIKGDNPLGGAIDHHDYEFSSVLRFIEDIFGVKPLTLRDRQADPLTGAFDFTAPPDMDRLILPLRSDCPYGTHAPFLSADNVGTAP
jgi:phospholipase C